MRLCDRHRFALVVGDNDEGQRQPPLQLHQLELGFAAQLLVERRHRLVEQQHARALDQRARQRHALALAARQFVRLARPRFSSFTSASMSATRSAISRLGQAFLLEAEGDIVLDGEMRKQRVALEHHVDRPPIGRHLREIDAVEQDAAGIRLVEAGDHAQQGRLAAAGRTQQRKELALVDVERQLVDGGEAAEAACAGPRCAAAAAPSDRSMAQSRVWRGRAS